MNQLIRAEVTLSAPSVKRRIKFRKCDRVRMNINLFYRDHVDFPPEKQLTFKSNQNSNFARDFIFPFTFYHIRAFFSIDFGNIVKKPLRIAKIFMEYIKDSIRKFKLEYPKLNFQAKLLIDDICMCVCGYFPNKEERATAEIKRFKESMEPLKITIGIKKSPPMLLMGGLCIAFLTEIIF
jgi:hypothetical protein